MKREQGNRFFSFRSILIILLCLVLYAISSTSVMAEQRLGKIGCGGIKGSWYVFATAFSEYLRTNSNINLTVVPASGGMEGFKNVMKHKVDFGFIHSSKTNAAWTGISPFKPIFITRTPTFLLTN